MVKCQQQSDTHSCGFFAAAFAIEIAETGILFLIIVYIYNYNIT